MASEHGEPPQDLTPLVGSATDITPLTHSGAKPAHERTADEDIDTEDWNAIAASDSFKELLKAKRRFIIPATLFFVVYYFALPYLVGYHPDLMQQKVWGEMNWAYLFALSQFFMAWILAAVYVVIAAGWDRKAVAVLARFSR